MAKTVLVTGAAGFIGSHTAQALLTRGDRVIGLDNLNDYYDPSRKRANVDVLKKAARTEDQLVFVEGDFRDRSLVSDLFRSQTIDVIAHLGAMAGVNVSIRDPQLYYEVNLLGTLVLLDAAVGRLTTTGKPNRMIPFVFSSTSSTYGATKQIPFVETDPCDTPISPYASSKRGAELLGHAYHHNYHVPFTALRFFTVYGPRGRPDMMAYKVMDNMFFGKEVPLYNNGQMHRDWTYIDDIVQGVVAAIDRPMGYELINLGRGEPVLLAEFVRLIEQHSGKKAMLVPAPMPDTDIPYTFADISKAQRLLDYRPHTSVVEGVEKSVEWYKRNVLHVKATAGKL